MLRTTINIVKYEWLRRWKFFLAGLTVFCLVNIDFGRMVISKGQPNIITAFLFAVLWAMVGVLVFDHLGRLYKPLFKEEGTFLFSTPLSGYRILGGKILAIALEYIGVAVFVAIVFSIDYFVMSRYLSGIQIPDGFSLNLILTRGIQIQILLLLGYLSFLLTAFLSMVLAKSIFASTKYGGLLSFIFFIVITQVFRPLSAILGELGINHVSISPEAVGFTEAWLTGTVFIVVTAAVLFVATGYLLDKKVNV